MSAAAAFGLLECRPQALPAELAAIPQWVNWRAKRKAGNKLDKIPLDPKADGTPKTQPLKAGSSTDPATWGTFAEAVANLDRRGVAGLGFVLTADDAYTAIDLDHCIDPTTGAITPAAQAIIDRFSTYTERSPSGTGVRLILRGQLADDSHNKADGWIEVYDRKRFVTLTGVPL